MWNAMTRRLGRALAPGVALICLGLAATPTMAADQFQGTYFGAYVGYNWSSGRHYCYYASYVVDGSGAINATKVQSTEDVGTTIGPTAFTTDYRQFRREGLLLGSALPYAARAHGRLRDDLEAGCSVALYTQADWYLGLFGLAHGGPDLENSDLYGDFWSARYGYLDDGINQAHWVALGTEHYDGDGNLSGSLDWLVQGIGLSTDPISTTYTAYGAGYLTRDSSETGFYLDDGDLLIFTDVTKSTQWEIAFSLRKPTPGTMGPAMLNGSYTLAYYRYLDNPFMVPYSPNYAVMLSKVIFDGSDRAVMQITLNRSDGILQAGVMETAYTVDANGMLNLAGLTGGISPDGRTAVGVMADTTDNAVWGIFVLLKSSGIEDPAPLLQVLGLTN